MDLLLEEGYFDPHLDVKRNNVSLHSRLSDEEAKVGSQGNLMIHRFLISMVQVPKHLFL